MQLDDAFLQNNDGSLSIQDSVKTALIYIDNCRKDVLVRPYCCFYCWFKVWFIFLLEPEISLDLNFK